MKSWLIKCNCIRGKEPPHRGESLCAPTGSRRAGTRPHTRRAPAPLCTVRKSKTDLQWERPVPTWRPQARPRHRERRARDTESVSSALLPRHRPAGDSSPAAAAPDPPGRNRARYKSPAPAGVPVQQRGEVPRRRRSCWLLPAGAGRGQTSPGVGGREGAASRSRGSACPFSQLPSRPGRCLRPDLPSARRTRPDCLPSPRLARGLPASASSRGERRESRGPFPWRWGRSREVSEGNFAAGGQRSPSPGGAERSGRSGCEWERGLSLSISLPCSAAGGERRPGTLQRSRESFAPRSRRPPTPPWAAAWRPIPLGGSRGALLWHPPVAAGRAGGGRLRLPVRWRRRGGAQPPGGGRPPPAGSDRPGPAPACSPCLPPPASRRARCRGRARGAAALSLPEPAAASPEKPRVWRARRSSAACRAGGLRAPRTSPQVSGEESGGESGRGLPPAPELQPARSRHLFSGAEGLRLARSCRRWLWGHRETRPCPGRRGAGSERHGWVGFSLPEMDFLPPERSGLACRRLPLSAQLLHTLFCLRLVRNTLVLPSPAPPVGIPARPCPPGAAPRLRPPCPSDPASCPIAFIFTGTGHSVTFVCEENGGVLVIWKDERQMGMTRGSPYSLACEHNSVLNKSLTG